MSQTPSKRVLIIGAGPSGLVSCKEALDNGLDPIVFEKTAGLGGLWNPETGAVWPTMHTNLSKYTCSFTGFPWVDDQIEMFPSSGQMFTYLQDYAKHLNILPRIRFNHCVLNISKAKSKTTSETGWVVEWLDDKNKIAIEIFHAVFVCTGIFSKSHIPNISGLQNFTGKQLHSKDYKDGSIFSGQTVLVVGGAISGEQVASDLSNYAHKVIHSFRKPFWILNPYLHLDRSDIQSPRLPLDFVFYTRKIYSQPSAQNVDSPLKKNSLINLNYQAQQSIPELCIPEKYFLQPLPITISDQYLEKVVKGVIVPKKGNVVGFSEGKVILEDNEKVTIDAVVFSTGFKVSVPFLSEDILHVLKFRQDDQFQPLILYNSLLHPKLPNLYFVGMYKGPYFAVMELQARLACRLISGKIDLPNADEIARGLQNEIEIRDHVPRGQFPKPDYVKFADELAALAGSIPNLVKLKELSLADSLATSVGDISDLEGRKDEIYDKFMTTPVIPDHFNLYENPRSALEQIDKFIDVINKLLNSKPCQVPPY